jgi:hypothetical protein
MIALLLAVLIMCGMLVAAVALSAWVWHEHTLANQYRAYAEIFKAEAMRIEKLASQPQAQPTQPIGPPEWRIVYKVGKATKTVTLPGATESLALKALVKTEGAGIYSSVISVNPV